jgi:cell division protein FtsB
VILTPEIALLAATIALLLTLTNSLLVFSSRRAMNQQIKELRIELDANLSANHQLARHVRELQRGRSSTSQSAEKARKKYDDSYNESYEKSHDKSYDKNYEDNYSDRYGKESEHIDEDDRFKSPPRDRIREANQLSSRQQDTQSLAEKLGLSQSEAEIVSHLKPRRSMSQMVRESA